MVLLDASFYSITAQDDVKIYKRCLLMIKQWSAEVSLFLQFKLFGYFLLLYLCLRGVFPPVFSFFPGLKTSVTDSGLPSH